ncbi:MAG: hypothetical protein Phog2KO_50330 [Phototrophicaceae bacterium]
MFTALQFETDIIETAEIISQATQKILKRTSLTALQHQDMIAINTAINQFIDEAQKAKDIIIAPDEVEAKKHIRHDLRNHLNIIVGFSSLLVKELPDNLLLHMASIRQIYQSGNILIDYVDSIK